MQNHFYVYILKCKDGEYYVGHADNIDKRMSEHHQGLIEKCYTQRRRPVELIFLQVFSTRDDALMKDNWEEIKRLNELQKKI